MAMSGQRFPRLPTVENGSMTSFLLSLQTLKQREGIARGQLREEIAKVKALQQELRGSFASVQSIRRDLVQMQAQEKRFRMILSASQKKLAEQKMRERAMERARRQQENLTMRKKDLETAKFQGIVSELLTNVRYNTGGKKVRRAIRKARRKEQKK
jgi:hypothetical protein